MVEGRISSGPNGEVMIYILIHRRELGDCNITHRIPSSVVALSPSLVRNMSSSIYQSCATEYGNEIPLVVQCVADWIESTTLQQQLLQNPDFVPANFVSVTALTNWLLVLTGALIFFMQAGFAMVCAGAIRKKNLSNTVRLCTRNCDCTFRIIITKILTISLSLSLDDEKLAGRLWRGSSLLRRGIWFCLWL